MATGSVPEQRLRCVQSRVGISNSVSSGHWMDPARLQCWLAGRGAAVVPVFVPPQLDNQGSSNAFYFRFKPRYQTTRYALTIALSSFPIGTRLGVVTFPVGGDSHVVPVTRRRGSLGRGPTSVTMFYDVASQSTTEREISFSVAETADVSPLQIESAMIEEVPRTILTVDANDLGADRLAFWLRQAIAEPNISDQIFDYQNNLRDASRRLGLFQHSWSDEENINTTSGSFVDMFGAPIGILHRCLYSGETTRLASWRIRAKVSNGTTAGEVRVTNSAGSTTISIPTSATSWTWLPSTAGAPSTFAIDAEDNTTANGLRGGTDDDHTFEYRRTAGAGSVQVSSISVFDAGA